GSISDAAAPLPANPPNRQAKLRSIDRCAQTNGWRRLPTAEKLVFSLGVMLVTLFTASWTIQFAVIAAMLGLLHFGARVAWRNILTPAMVPLGCIAFSTLAQAVTVGGPSWFGIAPPEALTHATFVGLRSVACVLALLFLALTTPLTSILAVFRRVGL